MKNKITLFILFISLILTSCGVSKKIVYMQDADLAQTESITKDNNLKIQPGDKLSIFVTSKNPELATIFNLPILGFQPGSSSLTLNSGPTNEVAGYTVGSEGSIDFPIIGKISIQGLTREQVENKIKQLLVSENYIKDPVVTVNFMNMRISILGEVKKPGKFDINNDQTTLMEALSMAGDLTIYGKRDGVYVIRTEHNQRKTYHVDLRSTKLFDSPAYYLRQNDVIYVAPNSVRAGESTINDNNFKSISLWMSVSSVITSICILIFR